MRNGLRTPCCFAIIDSLSLGVPSPVTMLVRHAYSCRWSRHGSAGPLLARFPAAAAPESICVGLSRPCTANPLLIHGFRLPGQGGTSWTVRDTKPQLQSYRS